MTIAVQISQGCPEDPSGGMYNLHCFQLLAAQFPQFHFIFFADNTMAMPEPASPNISIVASGPVLKNSILQHYWYQYKLPKLLNKYNATHFISSSYCCSLRSDVEQAIYTDSVLLQGTSRYSKRFLKKFIDKSTTIFSLNGHINTLLTSRLPVAQRKSILLHPYLDVPATAMLYDAKEAVRRNYTNGTEYFLFYDIEENHATCITVLKAFSIFKKWQKSSMKLMLIPAASNRDKLQRDLQTYKHRDDVVVPLLKDEQALLDVLKTAYAAICLPLLQRYSPLFLSIMSGGVPLVLPEHDFFTALFGKAAAYTQTDEKNLSQVMMLLYKDESLRNILVQQGFEKTATLTVPSAAAIIANRIMPVSTIQST